LRARNGTRTLSYKRALSLWEKTLRHEHPKVASALENYAKLLRTTERESEANELEARAKAIREKGVR
jgi:hypothetical protein